MIMKQQNRINDPTSIDFEYIDNEIKANKHVIVQFSNSVFNDKILSQLNELCGNYDDSFGIRFYGNYSGSFDFKTLLKIPNVKCLYIDCLTNADNVLTLSELNKLQKLSLGVFEQKETEILNLDNLKKLSELIVTETRTKAFNLDYLSEYKNLKSLIIGGHTKKIEAIGEIDNLDFLSLNSVKKVPVSFINNLKKLKTLRFILGSRKNIYEIEENAIETLEIVWVRGFNDLSNIGRFKHLKNLLIEDQIQLKRIEFSTELPELLDLKIINCKQLNDLTGLENLLTLNKLWVYKTMIDFDTFITQKLPASIKTLAFYTSKIKDDKKIKMKLEKLGYSDGLE